MAALDLDEPRARQGSHVVREVGLADLEQREQLALAHRLVAPAQHVQDAHPQRRGQRARDRGDPLGGEAGIEAGRGREAGGRGRAKDGGQDCFPIFDSSVINTSLRKREMNPLALRPSRRS